MRKARGVDETPLATNLIERREFEVVISEKEVLFIVLFQEYKFHSDHYLPRQGSKINSLHTGETSHTCVGSLEAREEAT